MNSALKVFLAHFRACGGCWAGPAGLGGHRHSPDGPSPPRRRTPVASTRTNTTDGVGFSQTGASVTTGSSVPTTWPTY